MVRIALAEIKVSEGHRLVHIKFLDLIALVVQELSLRIQAQRGVCLVSLAAAEGKPDAAFGVQGNIAFQRHRSGAGAHVGQGIASTLGGERDAAAPGDEPAASGVG